MKYSTLEIWLIIFVLAIGSYLIRVSFLAFIGDRELPDWVLRHLRYTPVAVIPALVAPAVVWPAATGGTTDPARLLAAIATTAVGYWSKNVLAAIAAGLITLYTALSLVG